METATISIHFQSNKRKNKKYNHDHTFEYQLVV